MSTAALLDVREVSCYKNEGQPILSNINFVVNEGDVIVIRGQSGTGKSTLLKCLAHLELYSGVILYKGKSPQACGIPTYRTEVTYIPQRPSLLPLTPRDFVRIAMSFYSRRHTGYPNRSNKNEISDAELQRCLEAPTLVGKKIGISEELWDRNWADLSGGEAQRIMLSIGTSLGTAQILLLDEPTSALDAEGTLLVEQVILSSLRGPNPKLKAIVWITHSEDQARRVGSRFITVSNGTCHEEAVGLV